VPARGAPGGGNGAMTKPLNRFAAPAVERRTLLAPLDDLEFRDDDDRLIFIGHAAVFDRLSEDLGGFRERFRRGAFRKVLDRDPDVRFLINHDGLPLARTKSRSLDLSEDPRGLRVYAELAPTQQARDLRLVVKRGDVDQMSFAFSMFDASGERTGRDIWEEVDGQPVRTVVAVGSLHDVSVVTYPAYRQTDAAMRGIDVLGPVGAVPTARLAAKRRLQRMQQGPTPVHRLSAARRLQLMEATR
jgi:HK97 family phage prohead protease